MEGLLISPPFVADLSRVLGSYTHTLAINLSGTCFPRYEITQALWHQILAAFPLLDVAYVGGLKFPSFANLSAVCRAVARKIEVQGVEGPD